MPWTSLTAPLLPLAAAPAAPDGPDARVAQVHAYWASRGLGPALHARGLQQVAHAVVLGSYLVLGVALSLPATARHLAAPTCANGQPNDTGMLDRDCWGHQPVRLSRLREPWPAHAVLLTTCCVLRVITDVLQCLLSELPTLWAARQYWRQRLRGLDPAHVGWATVLRALRIALLESDPRAAGVGPVALTWCVTRGSDFHVALAASGLYPVGPYRARWPWPVLCAVQGLVDACLLQAPLAGPEEAAAANRLRWRSRLAGVLALLTLPYDLLHAAAALLFRHVDEWRRGGGGLFDRRWDALTETQLRCYCETPSAARARLQTARGTAVRLLDQTTSRTAAAYARLGVFVCGAMLSCLLALTLVLDQEFLHAPLVAQRSTTWWIGVLTLCVGALRVAQPAGQAGADASGLHAAEDDPEAALAALHRETFQLLPAWDGVGAARASLLERLPFGWQMLLEELMGLACRPWVLGWSLPRRATALAAFVRAHQRVAGLGGPVCDLAMVRLAEPGAGDGDDGARLAASVSRFQAEHRSWQPPTKLRRPGPGGDRTRRAWSVASHGSADDGSLGVFLG